MGIQASYIRDIVLLIPGENFRSKNYGQVAYTSDNSYIMISTSNISMIPFDGKSAFHKNTLHAISLDLDLLWEEGHFNYFLAFLTKKKRSYVNMEPIGTYDLLFREETS